MNSLESWALSFNVSSLKARMRLSTLLFFSFMFTAFASSFGQTEISLDLKNEKIVKILDEIEAVTEFKFMYRLDIYDFEKKISIRVENEPIKNVLDQIFEYQIDYDILDKKVLLKRKAPKVVAKVSQPTNTVAQQKSINGVVRDEDGNPLPGATVVEKGTLNGTSTDFDGNFSLVLENDQSSIEISYVGYLTQTVLVGEKEEFFITLIAGASNLDEIVVTGYTSTIKRNLTGAVSTIKTEDLQLSTSANLTKGLQGSVTGLVVRQGSPQPGYDDNPIYVRGTGTCNDSESLIVIDGVPDRQGGLSRLNPEEIESISVIKDATAAVYGSRSANGVIVVTTKKGKTGKVDINYSSLVSFDQPAFLPQGLNSLEWVTWNKEAYDYIGGSPDPIYSADGLAAYQNGTADGYIYPNGESLFDLAFDPSYWAPRSKHNLSFSGGNEKTTYFLSASIADQSSSIKDDISKFKQANIRMNLEQKLTNFLTLSSNILVRKEDNVLWPGGDPQFWSTPQNTPNALGRFLINVFQKGPLAQVYWPDGSKTTTGAFYDQIRGLGGQVNTSNLYVQSNFDETIRIP